MLLFVDACVRTQSRTSRLAQCLLDTLGAPYEHLCLSACSFPKADEAFLNERDLLISKGDFTNPMFEYAVGFSQAEEIVIAAPFWDLSFPSMLKSYLEQINVTGITFRYTSDGKAEGLCRAKKLYYVTTAGGDFLPESFGFGYVEALAKSFYGIEDIELIKATGLDIYGAPVENILTECEKNIISRFGPAKE